MRIAEPWTGRPGTGYPSTTCVCLCSAIPRAAGRRSSWWISTSSRHRWSRSRRPRAEPASDPLGHRVRVALAQEHQAEDQAQGHDGEDAQLDHRVLELDVALLRHLWQLRGEHEDAT